MAPEPEAECTSSPLPGPGRALPEATPLKAARLGARGPRHALGDSLVSGDAKSGDDSDSAEAEREPGPEDDAEQEWAEPEEDHLSGEEDVDEEAAVGEDEEEEAAAAEAEAVPDVADGVAADDYPRGAWDGERPEILPGLEGFNSRSTAVMRQVGVGLPVQEGPIVKGSCPPLQPHQQAVAFLLHPKSPVTRLLIDHPTGSGKTLEIIRVLDNYFLDPRPKVPIFPRHPVCRNFYSELLRWPNRYRDYYCCERSEDAAVVSRQSDWRHVRSLMWDLSHLSEEESRRLGYAIREVLEMKNMFYMGRMRTTFRRDFERRHPGELMPAAPMRALSYTSAGGCFTQISEQGREPGLPASALMKIGYEKDSRNVYTNKVVVMDEVHNLVRTNTQYAEQLRCLRDLLFGAKSLVLGGFTGTPILNETAEGRQLLDIIKGNGAPSCDEGFLSSFPMRPRPLFPLSLPRGIPDAILTPQLQKQLVTKVELHDEALRTYERKRRLGLKGRRLCAYCNVSAFFGSFHDGKSGTKERILATPADSCPKLYRIAQDVAESPQKALILISRQTGYIVMLELMRMIASQSDPPFQVATIEDLAEFNHVSNLRGEKFRVLVADASQCSEGVSFFGVRRTILADVPTSPSQLVQQCGRAIRMYGHRGLPDEEQTVTNHLYVATLPRWMDSELACWALRAQRKDLAGKDLEGSARALAAQLRAAGVASLEGLKAKVDAHGSQKRMSLRRSGNPNEKELLSTKDMILFLEMSGLLEAEPPATPTAKAGGTKRKAEGASTRKRSVAARQPQRASSWASGSARLAALSARLGIPPGKSTLEGVKTSMDAKASLLRGLSEASTSAGSSAGSTASADGLSSQDVQTQPLGKLNSAGSLDGSSSQDGPNSQDAVASQPVVPPTASDGYISSEDFAALGVALAATARACEALDGGMPQAAAAAPLAKDLQAVRASHRVAAAIRAVLPRQQPAADLPGITAGQIRSLHKRLARAHVRGGLGRALAAVRRACEDMNQSPQDEAWRQNLDTLDELQRQCGQVREAIEAVVPGACKDAAGTRGLPVEQLRALLGEFLRRRVGAGGAAGNSRQALVRAAQELYAQPSVEEAAQSFSPNTADEQALQQLADRTRGFAAALTELRAGAIDRELFAHWGDELEEDMDCSGDAPEEPVAEAAAEAPGEAPEAARPLRPVRLPLGWRLQWEVRGGSEASLFLDPRGHRYRKVSELKAALANGGKAPANKSRPPKDHAPLRQKRRSRW